MDRIVHYSINDKLSKNSDLSVTIRITTIGFPVAETLEYQCSGKWSEDVTTIGRLYNDTNPDEWESFQSRLLPFLDDGNMRVIMDIMNTGDIYYSDKYKLEVTVNSVDITE